MNANNELEYGDIRVVDLEVEDDNETITGYAEIWFDADKKFGLDLDEENEWLNMYVSVNPFKDTVSVALIVRSEIKGEYSPTYEPTENEKEVIREAIIEAVRKEYYSDSDDEYALKGFVRSTTFPYMNTDVLIHRGNGDFVEFYYNPDSNSCGQIVENYYYADIISDAYEFAKENSKTDNEMVRNFFEDLQSICRQYLDDVDTEYFDGWEEEFASNFDGWGEVIEYNEDMETLEWILERSNIKEEN